MKLGDVVLALALPLLAGLAVPAQAQTQARMAGAVSSPDGSPVTGVTIRLEAANKEGVNVESDSNKKGRYLIGMIRPGAYLLRVDTHGDLVLLRVKGKGVDAAPGHAVLWEIDREVSPEQPPKVNVGSQNQIELDIVVGARSMTAEARREAEVKAGADAFTTGFARVREGNFSGALELLEALSEKTPDHANTWYLIGFSRERLGRFEAALPAADRALSLDPSLAGAHTLRGRILKGLTRFPEAEAEFRKEVEQASTTPAAVEPWIALSALFKDTNRPREAIDALEHAVALDPSKSDALVELARLYSQIGERDKSATTLERAEKAGGGDDASVLNLAITAMNEGQYDRAERIALRLVEKGSSNANLSIAHSVLARCDLNRGNQKQGMAHLEQALALDPASSLADENRSILAAMKR